MKLKTLNQDRQHVECRLDDLNDLITQINLSNQSRPCESCQRPCPCSHSTSCTCACGSNCAHSSQELSIDGEQFPIEPNILALVFAFNSLKISSPYWSCEGHLTKEGQILRTPQVWFYSRSILYVKLINDVIHQLQVKNVINNPWHIRIAYADHFLETGFSLEPNINVIESPNLLSLQSDALIVANHLQNEVLSLARNYLSGVQYAKLHPETP